MDELLTVEQLAELLHKSPHSVRHDATRNPSALPPVCRIPHSRRLLWRRKDVETWLTQHVITACSMDSSSSSSWLKDLFVSENAKRRTGRPTKAEQIARRRESS